MERFTKKNFLDENTNFDLDLFFLDKEGQVIEIYKKAKAFSEDIIYSKIKAMFVLELGANQHQIKKGTSLKLFYFLLIKFYIIMKVKLAFDNF